MKKLKALLALFIAGVGLWFYRGDIEEKLVRSENSETKETTSDSNKFPVLYSTKGNVEANVIYNEPSLYGDVIVFDFEGTRCFLIDSANESCWTFETNSPSEYVTDTKYLLESSYTGEKDILVIGVGAGTLLKSLDGEGYKVDAVEINPRMPVVAEKYFGFPEDLDFDIHIDDGRHYLENTDIKYDAIVLDICYVNNFNAHLWTKEFYSLAKKHLKSKDGFIVASLGVVNNQSNITLENKIANAMHQSFPDVYYINRGEQLSGKFDMAVFYARQDDKVFFPKRDPYPLKWKFDTSYSSSTDDNLDEFVKLFLPATEAIVKQTKENFGEDIFLSH